MTKKRTTGTMAALGGFTAAIALLSGLPTAKADELADLRANQELLQQRLDQLAQAPIPGPGQLYGGGPPVATAGAGIVGGSFPRSFLVPGTDTSIRVGGTITVNWTYWINGGNPNTTTASSTNFGNNGSLNSAPLHVHFGPAVGGVFPLATNSARSRSGSISLISAQQSKVNFETRTPTAWGEARTFMEFDWANGNQFSPGNNALLSTDNLVPRLRFAYATLGGLLGGQANSNFSDPDASTDNINFGGNVGDPGVTRVPQIRYTQPLAPWGIPGAFSVSAEAPDTDGLSFSGQIGSDATCVATVTLTGCVAGATFNPWKTPSPDFTMAWYIPQPWGHMDFSAVLRPTLQLKDGVFVDKQYVGWGVHFSGDVKPGWFGWDRDDLTWQFNYGDGIGRYLGGNSTDFSMVSNYPAAVLGGGVAGIAAANNILAKTTVMWGGNVGYQHRWSPTLRSNISAGILHHDIANIGNSATGFLCSARSAAALAGTGACGANKELVSSEINLIWNPVPFADVGIEYFHGHRLVLSNLKGDVNGVISRFRVNF